MQRLTGSDQETSLLTPQSFLCCEMEHSSRRGLTLDASRSWSSAGNQSASQHQLVALLLPTAEQEESVNHHPGQLLHQRRESSTALECWPAPGPTHRCGGEGARPLGHTRPVGCSVAAPDRKQIIQDESSALQPARARKCGLGGGQGPGCLLEPALGSCTNGYLPLPGVSLLKMSTIRAGASWGGWAGAVLRVK